MTKRIACIAILFCVASLSSPAQTFKQLYDFCSQPNCTDGSNPYAALVQGTDGSFYGTTLGTATNGESGYGTIFKIGAGGHLTTLYTFCSKPSCADGWAPQQGLVQGIDGAFYGTTNLGGSYANCSTGCGTIFRMTLEGALTTLYSFCSQPNCQDGGIPDGTLIQATDGNFYGTTEIGGTGTQPQCEAGCGTVFRMTPAGRLTFLYSFCSEPNCADGATPFAGVIQAADGNLYGTAHEGGYSNNGNCLDGCGTVFEITLSGNLTTLYTLLYTFCSQQESCPDGYFPASALVQGTDGNLYGTTLAGGNASNGGTAFQITSDGGFKTLYTFCSEQNCDDGGTLYSGLIQGTDGNLYGVNTLSGKNRGGTAFQLTTSGTLKTLYTFCSQPNCTDGTNPVAALIQSTNGAFYGTTDSGGQTAEVCLTGVSGCGTAFSLSMGLHPFAETRPTSGSAGSNILILGNNLTGATSVTFNGTPATFTVALDTLIRATIPVGATSGYVRVTTPKEALKSNQIFKVTP